MTNPLDKLKRLTKEKSKENKEPYDYSRPFRHNHGFSVETLNNKEKEPKAAKAKGTRKEGSDTVKKPLPDPQELIADELAKGKSVIGYLFTMTKYVLNHSSEGVPITLASVAKKWHNSLDMGGYAQLLKDFVYMQKSIENKTAGREDGDYSDNLLLRTWMNYLQKHGLYELYENEGEKITVTENNRGYYDNGSEFSDGALCRVVNSPVMLNNDLYYTGLLDDVLSDPSESAKGSDVSEKQPLTDKSNAIEGTTNLEAMKNGQESTD